MTEAAARLQQHGLIRHSRGHITVLDGAGLETRTCDAVVKKEYDRLLPPRLFKLRQIEGAAQHCPARRIV